MASIIVPIVVYLICGAVNGYVFNDRNRWDNGIFFACLFGWGFVLLFAVAVLFLMAIDVIFEKIEMLTD